MLNNHKELDPVFYGYNAAVIRDRLYREPFAGCFRYHWHERMELILVREGSINVNFGVKELTVHAPSVIILPPCRLHGGYAGENGAMFQTVMFDVATYFNNTPASEMFLHPITAAKVNFEFFSDHKELLQAMEELFSLKGSADPTASLFVSSMIYRLIALLYKYCRTSGIALAPQNCDKKFEAVLSYVEDHPDGDLSLAHLAQTFGYSPEHLCRKFKSVTGLSTTAYVKLMRLEKSKQLLKDSNQKIGAIAAACGFSDFSYFCRCFKAAYRITPGEYLSLQHHHSRS